MPGELFGYLLDKLFEAKALDVWYTPIYMKKNRPGITISVLCNHEDEEIISGIILKETTTLGVRSYSAKRKIFDRTYKKIATKYGTVTIKVSWGFDTIKALPEFDDCKKLSTAHNIPIRDIYNEAIMAYMQEYEQED